jgi:hypothetical protein
MARRRMNTTGYGSTAPLKASGGGFPLPPPPDGQPPVRLPFGHAEQPMAPAAGPDQPNAPEDMNTALMRLLQTMGKT